MVDKILRIENFPERKDPLFCLPSPLILEFEHPVFGWTEQAPRQCTEVVNAITGLIDKDNILPKFQSQFCDIDLV